jgi:MFS family permease
MKNGLFSFMQDEKMKKIHLKKFYLYYYLASFFYDFVFAYIVYAAFFEIKGLSVFEISLLFTWWALAGICFEIPTGAIADYWSRKKLLALAPIIKAGCFLLWFWADGNFFIYGLGFSLWALSESLVSGCSEALLYDTMAFFKEEKKFEKALGKKFFLLHISVAFALLLGGFIAHYDLDGVMLASIFPLFLSAIFAWKIPEFSQDAKKQKNYFSLIRISWKELTTKPVLFYLGIYLFAISIFTYLEEYDSLYMKMIGLPIASFGVFGFFAAAVGALGSYYAYKLQPFRFVLYVFPLISGILLIFVGTIPSVPILILGILAYFICSPLFVIMEAKVQENISSHNRATLTSTIFFLLSIFGVLLFFVMGLISKIWNLQAIYFWSGVFLICFGLWSFCFKNKIP